MTAKEKQKTAIFIRAAMSAVANLRWYIRDYDSYELKDIADELEEAIKEFTRKPKSRTKSKKI